MFVLPILLATFFIVSCSKNGREPQATELSKLNGIEKTVAVSKTGFLVFATLKDAVAFNNLLTKTNKEDVFAYLVEKGFKRRKYSAQSRSAEESLDSTYNVYFNEDGLVQLENIIMKISGDEKFIYTMTEENLTNETLAEIITESYNAGIMNKITLGRQFDVDFDIKLFITEHPNGIIENPSNGAARTRPMFGTVTGCFETWYHDPISDETVYNHTTTSDSYFFWIHTNHHEEYGSGHCP